MPSAYIYELGTVQPEDDYRVTLGIDHDEVSLKVGRDMVTLSHSECEEFAHLYVQACIEAGHAAERLRDVLSDD